MSRGFPSMTALLGLLAVAVTRIEKRLPRCCVELGRTSLVLTSKEALVACLASWVSVVPVPEEFSVVGWANYWSNSSKPVRVKLQILDQHRAQRALWLRK